MLSDTPTAGRKKIENVSMMSAKTKNRRYKELDDKLGDCPNGIIDLVIPIVCWSFVLLASYYDVLNR